MMDFRRFLDHLLNHDSGVKGGFSEIEKLKKIIRLDVDLQRSLDLLFDLIIGHASSAPWSSSAPRRQLPLYTYIPGSLPRDLQMISCLDPN